jgi:hypothetical protein
MNPEEAKIKSELDAMVERQERLASMLYDRANTYNSIVMVIGYASFFSLWALTRNDISKCQALWAAVLISVSLIGLVIFETYKMIFTSWIIFIWKKLLIDTKPVDWNAAVENHKEFEKRVATANIWHIRIWIIQLSIIIPTGFLAAAIMLWAFLSALWR